MNLFKEKLDTVLDKGITDIAEIIAILGITKNELYIELHKIGGGYSTAGIMSEHGTITKN